MSVLRRIPASLLFLALTALPGLAREVVVTLDPAKSTVQFTLGDVLHTVHGTFKIKSGEVRYDPDVWIVEVEDRAGRHLLDDAVV